MKRHLKGGNVSCKLRKAIAIYKVETKLVLLSLLIITRYSE